MMNVLTAEKPKKRNLPHTNTPHTLLLYLNKHTHTQNPVIIPIICFYLNIHTNTKHPPITTTTTFHLHEI